MATNPDRPSADFNSADFASADSAARIVAGAMSGTSADGVDAALVAIAGRGLGMSAKLLHHHHVPYDPSLRSALFAMRESGQTSLAALASVGRHISLTYARAVNEALGAANLKSQDVAAVAAHGQTLFHAPPDTIQWLDPALLAAETGCAVISDFRRADCAAGGQGAPLVPFADFVLFRHPSRSRLLVNIGGIANVTYLPATESGGGATGGVSTGGGSMGGATAGGGSTGGLIAFDTGPGNCISDELMRELHPDGDGFDVNGALASHGNPDEPLVLRLLTEDYFAARPPKSTDGPSMISMFHRTVGDLGGRSRLPDLLATACLLTAAAVGRAVREFLPDFPDDVFVSGGGTNNLVMMAYLRDQLGGRPLRRTEEQGIPSSAKEAIAFALLGAATLDGEPSNVPSATGARKAVILGSITPRPA